MGTIEHNIDLFYFILFVTLIGLVGMIGSQFFIKKWHISWSYNDGLYIVELSKGKQCIEISGPTIEDIKAGLESVGIDSELIDAIIKGIRRDSMRGDI